MDRLLDELEKICLRAENKNFPSLENFLFQIP